MVSKTVMLKSQIPNPKFQINSNDQNSPGLPENLARAGNVQNRFGHWIIGIWVLFVIWCLGFGIYPRIIFAESSVNVPIHHWSYEALDVLSRAGLVDNSGLTTKPITRMDAARLTEEAIYRIQNEKTQFSAFDEVRIKRAEEALDRLIEEFRPELLVLGVKTVAKDDEASKELRFKLADPIYTQTVYADLKKSKDIIYENQRGFHLKDGFNSRTRMSSWVEFNEFFAFQIEPVLNISSGTNDLDIETGYAKLSFWNTELEAGRDSLWWGPGYHGAMLLSDNAYPLNLVKISNAHPFLLPWKLDVLGKTNIDFFVAQLDKKRDYKHPYLSGWRIEVSPFDCLTFGASKTSVFGGKGRPHLSFGDYLDIFTGYGKNELSQDVNKNLSDQKAAFDFKLNIPLYDRPFEFCTNLQLYGEWAGEDKFAPWENESPGYLAGLLISDVFKVQSLDFRTEYAHNNSAWYTHGIYTTGYKYKGDVIGHHMGGDAQDLFMRLSKEFTERQEYFERFTLAGQFDYEKHNNSLINPERKYEIGIDGTFYLSDAKSVSLLYEYEAYKNFGSVSGSSINNNIIQAEANIKF